MSDERFDAAIRDALLADDPGAVPVRLRTRMALIPEEAAGKVGVTPWRARIARNAVPLGVLAAAAIIAVVFGGIALRGQQTASVAPSAPVIAPSPVSSAAPPASAGASAPATPSASAAPAPSGPIAIDPSSVIGLSDGTFAISGDTPPVSYYRWVTDTVSEPVLGYRSIVGNEAKTVVWLKNGHDIGAHAITNAGIVWVETWYTDKPIDCGNRTPCAPHMGQPMSWALNLTTLDGTTTPLDHGVVSRVSVAGEAQSPMPPAMAAQGDTVVYAVPDETADTTTVIVRSLPGGSELARYPSAGYVWQLGVWGDTLITLDAVGASAPGTVDLGNSQLEISRTVHGGAGSSVEVHPKTSSMAIADGGTGADLRIAWTSSDTADRTVHVAPVANGVVGAWTAITPVLGARGSVSPALVGDGVAWLAQTQDSAGAGSDEVDVWRPGWATPRLVPDLGAPDWLGASAGKLLFGGTQVPVLKSVGAPVGAIDAAALFGN